jgi:protein-tyrosine kinase
MERIKQAIDRAKREGMSKGVRHRWAPPPVMPGNVPPGEVGEINYSHTRVSELDPAHLERHRIVAFNKSDPVSASFDLLRTQVLHKMAEHGWRTLAIVSPTPECGKTVVAINLAISIAQHSGKTAMLVDFDLRRPRVATYLGLRPDKSLHDVLAGQAELAEAMINPGIPKLVVLPNLKPVERSAEALSSKRVVELIAELRDRYHERVVVFDLPPLLNTDDAITTLPKIDCALMVVGNGMVSKTELEESLHHLHSTNFLGVVLNKADIRTASYY